MLELLILNIIIHQKRKVDNDVGDKNTDDIFGDRSDEFTIKNSPHADINDARCQQRFAFVTKISRQSPNSL